jgi:phage replication-related protein YjqB (UPF0714/DUF867 family)
LRDAGFEAKIVTTGDHAAVCPNNICNRGLSGAGVQLELTKALRELLLRSPPKMAALANPIRSSIADRLELRP